jgi:hypothetical protein
MTKVLKVVKKPVRALGEHLQDKANKMLRHGKIDEEYIKIRKAAEWHLRMWAWERTTPYWKLPKEEEGHEPLACKKVKCPNLPAGSEQCRGGECP